MKFDLYTQSGEKKGQIEGSDKIFAIKPHTMLMHQSLVRQLANARRATAHTKTRGEVAGSGIKIYNQKHTGNARHGDRQANLFRGGGVVFGPRVRNFTKLMPQKQRMIALFSALSSRATTKDIIALESFTADAPKTKIAAEMIKKLPVKRTTLVVIAERNGTMEKSFANLPNAKVITCNLLNISDVLKFKTILFVKDAIKKTEEHFLSK
jgi:large subunit ribosomal protein L4